MILPGQRHEFIISGYSTEIYVRSPGMSALRVEIEEVFKAAVIELIGHDRAPDDHSLLCSLSGDDDYIKHRRQHDPGLACRCGSGRPNAARRHHDYHVHAGWQLSCERP